VAGIIFSVALLVIACSYLGYPVFIFVLSKVFGKPVRKAAITPSVSIIIAAYNEELDIGRKLENTLALHYPESALEIIVASDCSTDATDVIVRSFAPHGVVLFRQPERLGKTAAQNRAVDIASGDIILFSDATTVYDQDCIHKMVHNFADPDVGCVSGNVVYVDPGSTAVGHGMRTYWGYEVFLRQCESLYGSLVGVCGCIYAVRRRNYRRLAPDMCSDFVIASEIFLQGLRTVYEPEAIATELTNSRGRDEFRMRVRICEQTISSLYRYREVLNPFRHGAYAFQMLMHKVMRYCMPALLAVLFISNLCLASGRPLYAVMFAAQSAFYVLALAGWLFERLGVKAGPLGFPYYFTLSNTAMARGFVKFARGQSHVVWQPIRQ
jgi:cellulose synthase/poly-beta-1,6-N-acetylglucosamine synthase-like glycosyltransferase